MKIILNGEPFECDEHLTLSMLAQLMSLEGKRYAIELNREIIPKAQHSDQTLAEGDHVEVVQAIGGG